MNGLDGTGAADLAQPAQAQQVVFVRRKGLLGLLTKNLLLNIVSLSFYRFWARTALRRFYWSSVAFAGEPLEYTGRGLDLFIGFLIALAILTPIGFAYSTFDSMTSADPLMRGAVQVIYLLVLLALALIARYRARRYRLSRTSWRGIRFAVDGSTLRYVLLSLGWWLAVLATLGIAAPWKRAAQRAYLTRTTTFGDRRFTFAARPSALLLLWVWVLILAFGPVAWVVGVNADIFMEGIAAIRAGQEQWRGRALTGVGLLMIVPTLGLAAYVFYRVAELRLYTEATTLDGVSFRSTMGGWGVLFLLVILAVVACVSGFGIFMSASPVVVALLARGWQSGLVIYVVALGGLAIWAAILYFFTSGWLRRTIVATYFESVTVRNPAGLDAIGQSLRAAPTRGEGLADSFEFGAD